MKKLLSLAFVLLLSSQLFATQSADFSFDEAAFNTEMAELNQLETSLLANNFNLESSDTRLNNQLAALSLNSNAFGIDDMEWGAFAWGFCCWPIGFFVIAINSGRSSDEKLSFWIGMGVSVIISAISAAAGAGSAAGL
ncbi:MAG: hypothetical protein ACK417_06740 [Bacteroidia bacterium]